MEKKKKKWVQPELIVLVRRKPEEGILGACKESAPASGPLNTFDGCYVECDVSACETWVGT